MPSEKICPVCKTANLYNALACSSCGTVLNGNPTNIVVNTEYVGGQASGSVEDASKFIDTALIPEDGVGVQVVGAPKPYYVPIYKKLIIGRETDATLESVLDLSDQDGFNLGVSRRHVMLQRTEFGFEVTDLSSRNGTWLNDTQLIPNKPYPLASGSQLRLGRMRLFIVYHVVSKGAQTK